MECQMLGRQARQWNSEVAVTRQVSSDSIHSWWCKRLCRGTSHFSGSYRACRVRVDQKRILLLLLLKSLVKQDIKTQSTKLWTRNFKLFSILYIRGAPLMEWWIVNRPLCVIQGGRRKAIKINKTRKAWDLGSVASISGIDWLRERLMISTIKRELGLNAAGSDAVKLLLMVVRFIVLLSTLIDCWLDT